MDLEEVGKISHIGIVFFSATVKNQDGALIYLECAEPNENNQQYLGLSWTSAEEMPPLSS